MRNVFLKHTGRIVVCVLVLAGPEAARAVPFFQAVNAAQDNVIAPSLSESIAPEQESGEITEPDDFQTLVDEIRDNDRKINRLYTTMPIGFPVEQAEYMTKIDQLKTLNRELTLRLHQSAIDTYKANPNGDPQVAQIVFDLIAQKLDGTSLERRFDPKGAFKLASTMLEHGSQSPQIAYQAFRAAFAIHDFEAAQAMIDRIESTGARLNSAIHDQLTQTAEKWQREQEIRLQEKASDNLPRVQLETDKGTIVIELFEDHAPQTVGNFINLVEKGFYDDLVFHVVRPGLLSQTGCPQGDGDGDPGYQIPCETDREEIRHFFAGTVGMSNEGKDTGGSQFFISHQPNGNFDGSYTAFGRVIEGLDVVYQLTPIDKTTSPDSPINPSKVIRATVLRKRDHAYAPTRLAKKPDDPSSSIPDLERESPPTPSGR